MSWEEGLSPEQRQAAGHFGQHARLLAGPGTGKTRVLTSRVAHLVEARNVAPTDILAQTFTRAAAAELRSRVSSVISDAATGLPHIGTLHSFALQTILRYGAGNRLPSPIRIADDSEERWIIEEDIKRILGLERIEDARDLIQQLSSDWEQLTADIEGWDSRFPNPRFLGTWREHRAIFGYTLRAELVYQLKRVL